MVSATQQPDNLVLFVQFKKRKKQPSRSVTFSKAAGLTLNFNFDLKSKNDVALMLKKGRIFTTIIRYQ